VQHHTRFRVRLVTMIEFPILFYHQKIFMANVVQFLRECVNFRIKFSYQGIMILVREGCDLRLNV